MELTVRGERTEALGGLLAQRDGDLEAELALAVERGRAHDGFAIAWVLDTEVADAANRVVAGSEGEQCDETKEQGDATRHVVHPMVSHRARRNPSPTDRRAR